MVSQMNSRNRPWAYISDGCCKLLNAWKNACKSVPEQTSVFPPETIRGATSQRQCDLVVTWLVRCVRFVVVWKIIADKFKEIAGP